MPRIVFDPPKSPSRRKSLWLGIKLWLVTFCESLSFLWEWLTRGATHEMSNRHIETFSRELLRVSCTQLRVAGRENIDPAKSYIYMSNHQSVMDIPVMLLAPPQPIRMLAKEVLFKIPFFGAAMRGAGFIPIDRKNLHRAKQQLEQVKSHLQRGDSIWIAPEGTRNRTTELLPFKKGGFHVALQLGIPIVPVWIEGAEKVIAANGARVTPNQPIHVFIGEPILTEGLGNSDLPDLMHRVKTAMLMLR